jgi:hypothetical protein
MALRACAGVRRALRTQQVKQLAQCLHGNYRYVVWQRFHECQGLTLHLGTIYAFGIGQDIRMEGHPHGYSS